MNLKNALSLYVANRKVALLTFEIFWIAVFVLEQWMSTAHREIAQFQYVNF